MIDPQHNINKFKAVPKKVTKVQNIIDYKKIIDCNRTKIIIKQYDNYGIKCSNRNKVVIEVEGHEIPRAILHQLRVMHSKIDNTFLPTNILS